MACMSRLFYPLHTFLLGASLLVTPPSAFAREPQTSAPEVRATPKGYDAKIVAEPLLVTSTTADGVEITYPKTDNPQVTIVKVTVPPGATTGWHTHPFPAYGYVISGEITVELGDGRKNVFKGGEAVAEVVNTLHNGTNTGSEPTVILMIITGEKGTPIAIAGEKPAAPAK